MPTSPASEYQLFVQDGLITNSNSRHLKVLLMCLCSHGQQLPNHEIADQKNCSVSFSLNSNAEGLMPMFIVEPFHKSSLSSDSHQPSCTEAAVSVFNLPHTSMETSVLSPLASTILGKDTV